MKSSHRHSKSHSLDTCFASDTNFSCLLRHKSLISGGSSVADRRLTPAQKKTAESVRLEFESLIKCVGIDPLLFVTLTFPNPS